MTDTRATPTVESPKAEGPPRSEGLLASEVAQVEQIVQKEQERLGRIPLLLPLLGTFGLVTTFYGFEKILDRTPFIDQPHIMIFIGVTILLLTGAAANKL